MNKRGIEWETWVGLIAALVLLVLAVLFISNGGKLANSFLPSNNIQSIQTKCVTACSTADQFNFCYNTFELDTGTSSTFKGVTCYFLSNDTSMAKYGVTTCTTVSCPNIVFIPDNMASSYSAASFQSTGTTAGSAPVCTSNLADAGKTVEALVSNTLYSAQC